MAMVAIRLAKMVQDGCGMEPDGQKSLSWQRKMIIQAHFCSERGDLQRE
eukprot:SAG11_NODE_22084_length_412_cov_1.559105_1_plen_48_part_10